MKKNKIDKHFFLNFVILLTLVACGNPERAQIKKVDKKPGAAKASKTSQGLMQKLFNDLKSKQQQMGPVQIAKEMESAVASLSGEPKRESNLLSNSFVRFQDIQVAGGKIQFTATSGSEPLWLVLDSSSITSNFSKIGAPKEKNNELLSEEDKKKNKKKKSHKRSDLEVWGGCLDSECENILLFLVRNHGIAPLFYRMVKSNVSEKTKLIVDSGLVMEIEERIKQRTELLKAFQAAEKYQLYYVVNVAGGASTYSFSVAGGGENFSAGEDIIKRISQMQDSKVCLKAEDLTCEGE